jgi:uncharacterized protein (DUF885 family)
MKLKISKSVGGLSILFLCAFCLGTTSAFAAQTPDAEYETVAEEYIKGYFAARPLQGTALGLHEYDGKIGDYSRLALDAELARLRRFDDRLKKFDVSKLGPRQSIDLRILQAAIKKNSSRWKRCRSSNAIRWFMRARPM